MRAKCVRRSANEGAACLREKGGAASAVLLEEHDNILRSYQAQKHGSGDGMGAIAGQRMDLGLGPV